MPAWMDDVLPGGLLGHTARLIPAAQDGYTPLHRAVLFGHVDVVSALVRRDHGADTEKVNTVRTACSPCGY